MTYLTKIVKIIISTALIIALFQMVDGRQVWDSLKNFHMGWYAFSILLGAYIVWTQAMRWREMMWVGTGHYESRWLAVKMTLVGYFFNTFLPSGMGGDVVKSWMIGTDSRVRTNAMISSLASRLLGGIVLCLFFWIALFGHAMIPSPEVLGVMIAGTLLFSIGLLMLYALMSHWEFPGKALLQRFIPAQEMTWEFRKIVKVLPGTLLMQVAVVLSQYAFFKTIDITVDIWMLFLLTPFVAIVTMIPVSINGIGVREWAVLFSFGQIPALGPEGSLASTAVGYLIVLLQALAGCIVYVLGDSPGKSESNTD